MIIQADIFSENMKENEMKRFLCILVVAALIFGIIGCGKTYFFDVAKIKDVITYIIGANDLDNITFTPSASDGSSGTYQVELYSFDFATSGAEATNDYANKSWFQTSGRRGTYVYNEATMVLALTTTEVYRLTDSAITAGNSYSADYNWIALFDYDNVASWAGDYVLNESFTAALTQDNLLGAISDIIQTNLEFSTKFVTSVGIYFYRGYRYYGTVGFNIDYAFPVLANITVNLGLLYVADPAVPNTWKASVTRAYVNGDMVEETYTYTITATAINHTQTYVKKPLGQLSPGWLHFVATSQTTINGFYINGVETGATPIDAAWKAGNVITFNLKQTNELVKTWIGNTGEPSAAPSVDGLTGEGSTFVVDGKPVQPAPGTNTVQVYENRAPVPMSIVLSNQGGYIYHANFNSAGRSIDQQ